jgi:hypothetical protein
LAVLTQSRAGREFAHAEITDDKQRYGSQQIHLLFARAIDSRLGYVIEEQRMGLTIKHAIALLEGGLTDGRG